MKDRTTALFLLATIAATSALLAFDDRDADGVRLAKSLYVRSRVDDLRDFGVQHLRERIAARPIQETERRIALIPCVYRDDSGKQIAWGLDLPQPDREWVTFEKTLSSTVPINAHLVRFTESTEHQCWCVVVWHSDWKIVPAHGTVNCLTNAVAVVSIPKDGE